MAMQPWWSLTPGLLHMVAMGWRLLLATLIGEVDMKRILILTLTAAPFALAGCGGDHREREEQTPAVEEVRPAPPPPATAPPETMMIAPDTVPGQPSTPGETSPMDTEQQQF